MKIEMVDPKALEPSACNPRKIKPEEMEMVVGDIQGELAIPNSTLSHHLEKLKNEDLVTVRREGTYLWYKANTAALQELLNFLYAECCTRNKALKPEDLVQIRQGRSTRLATR
jgi:DNA-binding transcriptional ArsR family regulator